MKFSEKSIRIVIAILKPYYLILPILTVLLFIFLSDTSFLLRALLPSLVAVAIFVGLHKTHLWVVFLILIVSSFAIVSLILYQPENASQAITRPIGLFINLFQLYFFTRREVRDYFKSKGTTLFGG